MVSIEFILWVIVLCQILEETYKLEFLYSGLETRQVATIHHVRLQAKALQLVLTARTKRGYGLIKDSYSAIPLHTLIFP